MSVRTVAVHSFKGGAGKSFIASNIAALYAARGLDTCLLGMDFRAPSLHAAFQIGLAKLWFNDYLDGRCRPEEVLIDVSAKVKSKAKLYVAPANPSPSAIKEMMAKSTGWEQRALARLLDFINWASRAGLQRCVIDTGPGYLYSSINAVAASDVVLLVVTSDRADLEGARQMASEIYKPLGRKVVVVMNKAIGTEEKQASSIASEIGILGGVVGCYCDVASQPQRVIYIAEEPEHPINKDLSMLLERIEGLVT
ncbi:MAG: AAA family ATPase [Candidatus Nezhaarchaeota archaeon]|nr:AAA family ATPase [Candidatus Nezhaarchaeota archaeon]